MDLHSSGGNLMNKNEQLEIVTKARDILANKGWTQGNYARNQFGTPVYLGSSEATCFCAVGALALAAEDNDLIILDEHPLLDAFARRTQSNIADWNDQKGRTIEQVLDLFDKVAEDLKK
jgi:hypothetical protein